MATNIEMPKLSDTMTEGTLVKWIKQVGDTVEIGDIVAEIETDKATMEMESFDDGILLEQSVQEGEKAAIGATLGVLGEEGENPAATSSAPLTPAANPAPEATPAAAPAAAPVAVPTIQADGSRLKVSPLARKIAATDGLDLTQITGSGPGGRIVKKDLATAPKNAPQASAGSAAPAAVTAGLAAAATGAAALRTPAASTTSAPAPAASALPAVPVNTTAEHERIELSSMRKIIADRLLTSKTTIPHFYLHTEVDSAALMNIRKQINTQAEATHGNKYSVNDFILKAVVNAAQAVPAVNAAFNSDHIIQYKNVGLSIAIAVPDGLVTPVIKMAEDATMLQISKQVKDFAGRARENKLKPNEFDGGTITVSNLGAFGVTSFDAIVNPPQSVILSVGGIVEKAVVKDGEIVPGLRMDLGVSCDHRVVDGAVAAQFLAEIKKLLESPALMLV